MDSLGTGTGTGFQDWTVSEPESESKKLEPGTSAVLGAKVPGLRQEQLPQDLIVCLLNKLLFTDP